jgi:hypothetical protein
VRLTFEGDSLGAVIGEMRAFLAAVEHPGARSPADVGGAYTGAALPACPVHLVEMAYRPAGTNGRTHRRFSASYRCPRPGCTEARWLDRSG